MAVKKNTLQTLDAGTDKDYIVVPINKQTNTTTTTKAVTPTAQTTTSTSNTNSAATGALSANNKLLASANPVAYEGGTGVGTVVNKSLGNGTTTTTTTTTPPKTTTSAPAQAVAVTPGTPTVVSATSAPQVQTVTPPSYVAPTVSASSASYQSAEKPTFEYNKEKPTYTSQYSSESNSYTPQSYEASSYSGMGFSGSTYKGKTFEPSQEYYQAMEETKRLLEDLKGGRTSFTDKITNTLQAIEDTPDFQYDFNKDPLFQNMLNAYMRDGRVAMQDTMGQAAALTGGYGSSYSQAVGNQAYNRMVQEAYDNLPDYYNMALTKYQYDLQNKYNLLGEYRASDATEYERKYNDWANQYTMANDQFNRELQKANFDEQSRQWAENLTESSRQHAQSLSAQTAMHAQSLSEQSKQWAAEMNQSEQRYAQQLAAQQEALEYQRYRDSMSDYYRDIEMEYNKYLDSMDQYNKDRSFDYGVSRDAVADARYADATAYERYRDLISDARYEDATAYDRYRDSVADARDERNFNYNAGQDAIQNALNQSKFNYQKERDAIEDSRYAESLKASSTSSQGDYKDLTDTAKKTLTNAVKTYGYTEQLFDAIADMYDKYGKSAVDRELDSIFKDMEDSRSINTENGRLVNGFGNEINLGLAGNPAAVKNATFADLGNGKYYCLETGETVSQGQLEAWYGTNYTSHIRGIR